MHRNEVSTTVGVRESDGGCHLATQRWIGGFELIDFDHLFVRYQAKEATTIGVGARSRLARSSGLRVGQRDSNGSAFARVELVDPRGHAVRYSPLDDRLRVQEKAIDRRAWSTDMKLNASRSHVARRRVNSRVPVRDQSTGREWLPAGFDG